MERLLVGAILFILPFTELLRFGGALTYIRLIDILIGLVVLYHFIILKKKTAYFYTNTFIAVLLISFLVNINIANSIGFLYLGRTILYLLFSTIIWSASWSKKILTTFQYIFIGGLTLVLITGLAQYILYPNLRNLYYLGYDPHSYRLFGLFLDPNLMSIIFVWAFFYLSERLRFFSRFIILGALIIALLLTYSRIGWIAFGIGIFYQFFRTHFKQGISVIIFLIFILAIIALPRRFGEGTNIWRTNSIRAKVESWQQVIPIFQKHIFFGIGFNNTHLFKKQLSTAQQGVINDNSVHGMDSSLLTLLFTTGVAGIVVYGYWFLHLYRSTASIQTKIITITFFVHTLSINSFFTPATFLYFVFFVFFSRYSLRVKNPYLFFHNITRNIFRLNLNNIFPFL